MRGARGKPGGHRPPCGAPTPFPHPLPQKRQYVLVRDVPRIACRMTSSTRNGADRGIPPHSATPTTNVSRRDKSCPPHLWIDYGARVSRYAGAGSLSALFGGRGEARGGGRGLRHARGGPIAEPHDAGAG